MDRRTIREEGGRVLGRDEWSNRVTNRDDSTGREGRDESSQGYTCDDSTTQIRPEQVLLMATNF
jgi:hypothetical protein